MGAVGEYGLLRARDGGVPGWLVNAEADGNTYLNWDGAKAPTGNTVR